MTSSSRLDASASLPDQTLAAMLELAKQVHGPTVIIGFGSIPYPAVLLRDLKLRNTISNAVKAHGLGEELA